MSGRLEGKVAVVTGAARGQGKAHVRRFVARGACVVATDVLVEEGEALADELATPSPSPPTTLPTRPGGHRSSSGRRIESAAPTCSSNNAGIVRMAPLVEMTTDDYLDVIRVNQLGVFFGMRALAPVMARRGAASKVNISLVDGMAGMAK